MRGLEAPKRGDYACALNLRLRWKMPQAANKTAYWARKQGQRASNMSEYTGTRS